MKRVERHAIVLAALVMVLPALRLGAELSETQAKAYRSLRRDFLLVMPLAPYRDGALRKELSSYLTRLNAFIKAADPAGPEYQAVALYLRARVQLKVKKAEMARQDLDRCLALMQTDRGRAEGAPERTDVLVYRAFTFIGEGNEKVLTELEAIPAEAGKPSYREVGNLLTEWANALADAEADSLALRAYQLVLKYDLWHEEADDPQRRIDMLRTRLGQAAGAATQTQTAADAPAAVGGGQQTDIESREDDRR